MAGAASAWGVDVGVSSLKAIKLRRDGDRVTIEAFEVIEHDKFLTEPDVNRDALIRATLQKFMAKYALRNEVVYIGVPGSMTFARFVKLPPVETKKIPEIVRFEAIQQIPFPLEQVNWDYHTFQHPDSPDVEVGIFAMKKELVAQVMSNFRAVDMNVQGVVMSALAVYNAASYDGMTDNKGTIIIDMGAEHTDLVIMDQGRLWLRTINIGGNHFTDALAKSFKQPFARAETLKKTAATSKYQKQIYQAMRPIFADLVAEIQRSIGHYSSTHRDSHLERIVGMGSPFKLPNLQKYLQQELKIDVIRLDTFRQANVEKAAAFSESILAMTAAYGLAVQALGLAPIDTNLLPMEIARAMMWKKKQPWFIAAAAIVALGALGGVAQWFMTGNAFKASQEGPIHAENTSRLAAGLELAGNWEKTTDNFNTAKQQVDAQFLLLSGRPTWAMIYNDVMTSLPQARAGSRTTIVVTELYSEFAPKMSLVDLAAAATATPGGPPVPPPPPPILDPNMQQSTPDASVPSEHGMIVTLSGYIPGGNASSYTVVDTLIKTLAAKSVKSAPPYPKPYYFENSSSAFRYTNRVIDTQIPVAQAGGGMGMGGGGLMTPVPVGGGVPGAGIQERPWGAAKGPYYSVFVPDLVGYRPAPIPTAPGMPPQEAPELTEIPYAVDVYSARLTNPPQPKELDAYAFTLRFKVFMVDERPEIIAAEIAKAELAKQQQPQQGQ